MSQGLRIWDATGQMILNITDRLFRLHSTVVLPNINPNASVNFSIPGMRQDSSWFVLARASVPLGIVITPQVDNLRVSHSNPNATSATGAGTTIDILRA